MARLKSSGHTLAELLIAMALSTLIVAALVPVNTLGLNTLNHQKNSYKAISTLKTSMQIIEHDIKKTGLSGCLVNKTQIYDYVFTGIENSRNKFSLNWLSAYDRSTSNWYPSAPYFNNTTINRTNDAIRLLFSNIESPLTATQLAKKPQRLIYSTNCAVAQINRAHNLDAHLFSATNDAPLAYPLQSVIYYVRETADGLILYRQFLTTTGTPRNEPLVNNIDYLKIAYGEIMNGSDLYFKSASHVSLWTNVIAVYFAIAITIADVTYSTSSIVELDNLAL